MTFNKALKEAGEFGIFQKIFVCGFVHIAMVLMGVAYWIQVYILLVPPHRCKISPSDNIWSQRDATNLSVATSGECKIMKPDNWTEYENVTNSCPYGWVYDYSDLYPTFPSEYNWVCGNSWRVYTVHTCYWIGNVAGFILFGSMSDRFGRKISFIGTVVIMLLGDIGSYFAYNYTTLMIARFITATGEANIGTCAFVLAIEYVGPKYRVFILAVWSTSYTIAATILPFIVYAVHDWHYVLVIGWVVEIVAIILTCFMPESASWLITRNEIDKAVMCINRVAKTNKKQLSLNRIRELLLEEKAKPIRSGSQLNGEVDMHDDDDSDVKELSFLEGTLGLFRTPNLRKKMLLLTLLWMIAATTYVGNSLETTNIPLSFRLSYAVGGISELPANIICLLLLNKIGRRWANVFFCFLGGSFGIVAGFVKSPTVVLIMSSVLRLSMASTYDITFALSSELLPTVVRGRGVTIIRIFGGFSSAISPFIFSLSEIDKMLPFIVFGAICIVGGVATLFLPEPTGQPLPQTLEEGERFGKGQSFFYCPFSHREKTLSQLSDIKISISDVMNHELSSKHLKKTDEISKTEM